MAINLPNFRLIEVSKDEKGRYMKLEIQLPDGLSIIRWDLDPFTYARIKELVSKKHFDSLATDYTYELVSNASSYQERPKSIPTFLGIIRCLQGNRSIRIEFTCSERFAGNMAWFRNEIQNKDDLKHLIWQELS
jgi:hypothetical protein